MTDTFQLTPSESVRVLRSDAEAIEVEGTWGPGGSPPPKHFHPAQDERFEVLEGTLTARVGGQQRELQRRRRARDPAWSRPPDVERGRGAGPGDLAHLTGRAHRPVVRGDRRAARLRPRGEDGMPSPLAYGPYLTEYRDVFRLAGPQPVLVPLVRGLGVLGRLRGYRPTRA